MRTAVLMILAVAACGPSAAELKTAKSAVYKIDPHQLLGIAQEATRDEGYKIADVNEAGNEFMTVQRFYSPEGGLQSPGPGGFVHMDDHSVEVAFIVQVVVTDAEQVVVTVVPKTFQVITGSPKPRELAPDDPNLPTFVTGRADAIAVAIYKRAQPYVAK